MEIPKDFKEQLTEEDGTIRLDKDRFHLACIMMDGHYAVTLATTGAEQLCSMYMAITASIIENLMNRDKVSFEKAVEAVDFTVDSAKRMLTDKMKFEEEQKTKVLEFDKILNKEGENE